MSSSIRPRSRSRRDMRRIWDEVEREYDERERRQRQAKEDAAALVEENRAIAAFNAELRPTDVNECKWRQRERTCLPLPDFSGGVREGEEEELFEYHGRCRTCGRERGEYEAEEGLDEGWMANCVCEDFLLREAAAKRLRRKPHARRPRADDSPKRSRKARY